MKLKSDTQYWTDKANADKGLPQKVRYAAGYLDWVTYAGCMDESRPVSRLIKKAIKEYKRNAKPVGGKSG